METKYVTLKFQRGPQNIRPMWPTGLTLPISGLGSTVCLNFIENLLNNFKKHTVTNNLYRWHKQKYNLTNIPNNSGLFSIVNSLTQITEILRLFIFLWDRYPKMQRGLFSTTAIFHIKLRGCKGMINVWARYMDFKLGYDKLKCFGSTDCYVSYDGNFALRNSLSCWVIISSKLYCTSSRILANWQSYKSI